ncbi:hypothetical protein JCM3765_004330 [Sporobolomyces pararoseus]
MSTCTTSHVTQQPHSRPSKPTAAPSKNVPSSITRNLSNAKTSNPSPPNVAPKEASNGVGVLTPSIEAIWKSFVENGHGDVELLKLLLLTKSKEDERLTALDNLRTEQMRAANTMALHQYFYQYSAFYAAQQQQQQQAHLAHQQQSTSTRAPSPYSPTSPPPAPSSSFTASNKPSTKRPRAPSDASTVSNDSVSSSSSNTTSMAAPVKKARLAPSTKNASSKSPPPPPPPHSSNGSKPSHADVMELLRKKCQANQGTSPGSQVPSPSSACFVPPTPTSATTRKPSTSPPLRHSLMLRPALPPPSLDMPQVEQSRATPQASEGGLSPVVEEGSRGVPGVDRLAMLLRAGEMKAESD